MLSVQTQCDAMTGIFLIEYGRPLMNHGGTEKDKGGKER
jgi:hypothetical protein